VRAEPLHIEEVVDGLRGLLERAIGERVALVVRCSRGLPPFVGDRGQTEQLLMNIAVNARDAMPDGGTLTIEATLATRGETSVLQLTISDTGTGMSQKVATHVFDPFFTTKRSTQGSGLGLSTVYGIVADAGGEIEVASTVGQGTTFTITLPTTSDDAPPHLATDAGAAPSATVGGGQTILVVEDNDSVRAITVAMLTRNGYRVLEAADASGALVLADTNSFDLLLTDVAMPGLTGRELVERLRERGRAGRVLFMSGYSSDAFVERRTLDPIAEIIHKPFDKTALLSAVQTALGNDVHATT